MAKALTYEQQYDRMMRWYKRFEKIVKGRVHDMESDNYEDEAHAFFLNCYYLKDWIKNDPSLPLIRDEVEQFINDNECLRLCADICNGLKHLKVTKQGSGKDPQFGPRQFFVGLGAGETTIAASYSIVTTNGPIDAFELASECVKKWDGFISAKIKPSTNAPASQGTTVTS